MNRASPLYIGMILGYGAYSYRIYYLSKGEVTDD